MNTKVDTHVFANSSNILRVDYDNLTNVLIVYFRSGSIYQFVDVPYKIFEDFKICESARKFFTVNIKNKFEFVKRVK